MIASAKISLFISNLVLVVFSSRIIAMERNDFSVEPVLESNVSDLGEGPHWDSKNQFLYYVDAFAGYVHRLDTKKNIDTKIHLGDLVTIVIPFEDNPCNLLVSLRNKVVKLNWRNQKYQVLAECAPENAGKERFNDGKIDAAGRLWIGTVLEGPDGIVKSGGSLYRLDLANKRFFKMWWNFTLSNGMAWNKNSTLMYFNDSEERKTWRFDFDLNTGTLNNQRLFLDLDKHPNMFSSNEYPDGMTIDSDDFLWISMYNGGRIIRLDPVTRQIMTSIAIPAPRTTSLTFGGESLNEIYITTGVNIVQNRTDDDKQYPNAGKIFKIDAKNHFKGIESFNFRNV